MSSAGRFHDGQKWTDVLDPPPKASGSGGAGGMFRGSQTPIPPVVDGDGKIFVSIPSFRGTF